VLIINKTDLVSKKELDEIEGLCRKLNKEAVILKTTQAKVDLTKILNTNKFNFEKAQENSHWLAQDRYAKTPETVEFGITSFLYKAKRPFDNTRLYNLLAENFFLDLDPTPIVPVNTETGEILNHAGHNHGHDHEHEHEHDHSKHPHNHENEEQVNEGEGEDEEEEIPAAEIERAKKAYRK